ncbi:hypothetical protein D3C80_1837290 [compost metagenome]
MGNRTELLHMFIIFKHILFQLVDYVNILQVTARSFVVNAYSGAHPVAQTIGKHCFQRFAGLFIIALLDIRSFPDIAHKSAERQSNGQHKSICQ